MKYVIVFLVGGAICVIGQLLICYTRMTTARILVAFVLAGIVLTALGVYEPLIGFANAGASVPLTGFGYTLAKGAIDGARQNGVLGAITGGLEASSGGVAAAIFFAVSGALAFSPKTKK
ncbi:MAG: SpoVA/SpoVAEb family sporulation membrane protein [Clostridiales bacterium]|jgi:stage V sporulation protein AE|nr:SpoVA/SpoVAEb family sporulation membrane protein [Clostridiales bacterium]